MATINQKQRLNQQQLAILESEMNKSRKSVGVAYFLLILLGWAGAHQFYLGKKSKGLIHLAILILPYIMMILVAYLTSLTPQPGFDVNTGWSDKPTPLLFFVSSSLILPVSWIAIVILCIIDLFTLPWQTRKVNEAIEDRIIADLAKSILPNVSSGVNKPAGKVKDLSTLYGLKDD